MKKGASFTRNNKGMEILVKHLNLVKNFKTDFLICFVTAKNTKNSALAFLPSALQKRFKEESMRVDFQGELGTHVTLDAQGQFFRKVIIAGLGEASAITIEKIRRSAAGAVKIAKSCGGGEIAFRAPETALVSSEHIGIALSEAVLLTDYVFDQYKSKKTNIGRITKTVVCAAQEDKALAQGVRRGAAYASGTIFARDLVNAPGSAILPKTLVAHARVIAKEDDAISVTVFHREALQKHGFGGILGISQGSSEDPYFIHLVYKPKAGTKKSEKIGIVGKGVTFDTGGLSLKPAKYMEIMKIDMAGAAALLGVFKILKEVKPSLEIHGFIATCDNMPFSNAVKPGDIITSYNGKTIEVANTDAEGRIILADALAYACEQKMDVIIDIATLTGSCLSALGMEIGGLFANDDVLAQEILSAGEVAGEDHCRLPLYAYYKESITKNTIADIKNISTMPEAGAITAALFLQEFVTVKKWAHIDIGGSAYHEQSRTPYIPSGATGNPVRTLLHFLHLHDTKTA